MEGETVARKEGEEISELFASSTVGVTEKKHHPEGPVVVCHTTHRTGFTPYDKFSSNPSLNRDASTSGDTQAFLPSVLRQACTRRQSSMPQPAGTM